MSKQFKNKQILLLQIVDYSCLLATTWTHLQYYSIYLNEFNNM